MHATYNIPFFPCTLLYCACSPGTQCSLELAILATHLSLNSEHRASITVSEETVSARSVSLVHMQSYTVDWEIFAVKIFLVTTTNDEN